MKVTGDGVRGRGRQRNGWVKVKTAIVRLDWDETACKEIKPIPVTYINNAQYIYNVQY